MKNSNEEVEIVSKERAPNRRNIKVPAPFVKKLEALYADQSERVVLDVGGTHFKTCKRTLLF